jgi:dTDP-glucose 4,6-dehydratase
MKEKVLITGGLGFIFSHVVEDFVQKGYEVIVLDAEWIGSNPQIIDGSFRYMKIDVSNSFSQMLISSFNPHYIIHASAISDVDISIQNPDLTMKKNNDATVNVFEGARKCKNLKKLVYVSTDEVYGECETKKREDEILFPKNPYSCSKAFGSLVRITYDNTYPELKDKTAETRFCNVFGNRQDKGKIMSAIKKSLKGEYSIPIHEDGKGYREYIYVKNIPEAVELVMLKGDRTYNITLNDGYTVKELIQKAEELTNKKCLTHKGDRPGMDLKYQMDNQRIVELGWKPKYSFEEGLKEYLYENI